ncbi:acyl-CoA dehydratase activase [Desulfobacula toluolica]|uniref:Predicted CoA enzyme activase n=1 Tax=Desulfobacula toluolica (strain DSM 7467 / Tol2) TaxID=651182 RepID=K0NBY0_DESTT|nr:acyl-CoA dehydratase activase [Desulfobacula toluolica]CCK78221.1 predicted CoA enzyme activase [Desulfobacula toluolica Tol2]
MLAFGIDLGYAAIKTAVVNARNQVVHTCYTLHRGDIMGVLAIHLEKIKEAFSVQDLKFGAVTGSGKRILKDRVDSVNEVTALVEASRSLSTGSRSVVEIGAQTAKYITGLKEEDNKGIKIAMNANCSAGTGSFLEEQISRLNLNLEEYSAYTEKARSVPRIAGRCSVFAKTDIIHHQQGGVPVADILQGLAYAVVRNFRVSVMKQLPMECPILFTGGVANNRSIVRAFREELNLKETDLIIPEHFSAMGAIGAAVTARKEKLEARFQYLLESLSSSKRHTLPGRTNDGISLPPLVSYGLNDARGMHDISSAFKPDQALYLGIDVGSTSTNLVLINPENEVVDFQYLRTKGDPVAAVNQGLNAFKNTFDPKMNIKGTGVTGSGRYLIGKMMGTDIIKDEITAQAKAAVNLNPEVDTIFEIGGQDSKFIRLKEGRVKDFQMNKVCAAGTGSFIEEQAKRFDIPVEDFGPTALNANHPVDLGERCTVFIETTVAAHLSREVSRTDLAAGLCYSVVKNYLNRVVGQKKIGNNILFQGGLAHNQGVINAFRAVLGKQIRIPRFFSVTGAMGAALLARESVEGTETGLRPQKPASKLPTAPPGKNRFSREIQEIVFQGYAPSHDPLKKTVGMPRALFTFGMFSMFHTFFKALGFNVVLSEPSTKETIALAQEHAQDETCFPVKLVNGHIAQLIRQKVDYIFFPDLYTVFHPNSESRQNYGCAYMQIAFKMANHAMDLEKTGITLLAPTIAFHLGKEFMSQSFTGLGSRLERGKNETMKALGAAMKAMQDCENRLILHREKVLETMAPDEKVFVLISKIYGVADPILNLGIPDRLSGMGYKVIPFFDLPEGNIFREHPNMYWPFAQHILDPAYLIRTHPNLYAILLTHHGCGPDSVVSHFFSEIMSPKPFLNIEVDEHSSTVGVITRLEAFLNSISHIPAQTVGPMADYALAPSHSCINIRPDIQSLPQDMRLHLPNLSPYSQIFKEILTRQGICAKVMDPAGENSLNRGKRHTTSNEYYSLTALLGDVLETLDREANPERAAFFIPQTEGAEVDGQYSRFVRTRLDGAGYEEAVLVSPFIEDAVSENPEELDRLFTGLLAGDLIQLAPAGSRNSHLASLLDLMRTGEVGLKDLTSLAETIGKELKVKAYKKQIFVTGDPLLLFNDFLTGHHFSRLESMGYRLLYSPMSEYMLMLWKDWIEQNGKEKRDMLRERIQNLADRISVIDTALSGIGVFSSGPDRLASLANETLGFYAGANGRYRMAKCLDLGPSIDGIITVSPMYENTGISLNALSRGIPFGKPLLNLTLDGNPNQADRNRIEAFLFYL